MDPSRPPLGRGSLLSSSVHATTTLLLLLVLLATLLRLPISISSRVAAPAGLADQRPQEPQQQAGCDPASPLDRADPRLLHLMICRAIDAFLAIHFARFGRPIPCDPPSASCDMAWRARSDSDDPSKATTKDYRRFAITQDLRAYAYVVLSIDEYHSDPNARKPRRAATNATIAPPPALSRWCPWCRVAPPAMDPAIPDSWAAERMEAVGQASMSRADLGMEEQYGEEM